MMDICPTFTTKVSGHLTSWEMKRLIVSKVGSSMEQQERPVNTQVNVTQQSKRCVAQQMGLREHRQSYVLRLDHAKQTGQYQFTILLLRIGHTPLNYHLKRINPSHPPLTKL